MTIRTRRPERVGIRTRVGRAFEGEDRQQALVTLLFIAVIGVVVLILVGAVALAWYNDNLRPVAKVGSMDIPPQMLRDDVKLEQWRIARDEDRITQAQIEGTLDNDTAQAQISALDQQAQDLTTSALDNLIDGVYQSQLAADQGISVSEDDISAALDDETSAAEQRHVYVVTVEPQAADTTTGPTLAERQTALDAAQQALADLQAGKDFSTVAAQYGTDDKSKSGGDLGSVTQLSISDPQLATELFKLDQGGTTGVIRGDDGAYRIGRVTEIVPGAEDANLRSKLFKDVSEQNVRQLIGFELAAQRLQDKVIGDALGQTPEQAKLAVIFIEGLYTGDPAESEGEIDYSQIVFAPNDDMDAAPDLAADDPAWTTAQQDAQATFDELQAITDVEQRKTRFAELAQEKSDDETAADGGAVGWSTRDVLPDAIATALFDSDHTPGDVIGPVRSDAGYYVLLFNERRASPEDRVKAVQDALAQPGADFNAIAKQLSEGPEKEDGGEAGWFTQDQLNADFVDQIWALNAGQVSDPIEVSNSSNPGHFIIKVEDKQVRPLDPDQIPQIRSTAFSGWYSTQRSDAEANGTIQITGQDLTGGDLIPGTDQGTP